MNIRFLYLPALLLAYTSLHAQFNKPGKTIPKMEFTDVYNYRSGDINLRDFKGKLIILDFWDVTCLACIESFSKMDSLQKAFGDRIQIILVNKQSKDSTERFFAKRRRIKVPSLPFITNDRLLNAYFPHSGVPFHVWLNDEGVVQFINRGYNTTASHLDSYLSGQKIAVPDYKPNVYKSTLINPAWVNDMQYYSYFSRCIDGIRLIGKERNDYFGITRTCFSIASLYQTAYNEGDAYKFDKGGRTILEVRDSFRYIRPADENKLDEWKAANCYNYQSQIPKYSGKNVYQIMREDLYRFFGLEAKIETRKIKTLVLIRTSTVDKIKTSGKPMSQKYYRAGFKNTAIDSLRYFHNYPFGDFLKHFGYCIEYDFNKPFADATNYEGSIDIDIKGDAVDALDLNQLRKELIKYDLDLIEMEWPVDVLILKEKNGL